MVESLIFLFTYNSEAQKIEECFWLRYLAIVILLNLKSKLKL